MSLMINLTLMWLMHHPVIVIHPQTHSRDTCESVGHAFHMTDKLSEITLITLMTLLFTLHATFMKAKSQLIKRNVLTSNSFVRTRFWCVQFKIPAKWLLMKSFTALL